MADTNPTQPDPKKIHDFETDESPPVIKRYTDATQVPAQTTAPTTATTAPAVAPVTAAATPVPAPTPTPVSTQSPASAPAKVDPSGPAPTATPPVVPAKPAIPPKPGTSPMTKPAPAPVDPASKKKAILGCIGGFGALMLIFLVLSFIFLAQTGNGTSPIAKLLGINENVFVNGLITFVHIIFILISLVAFIFTMVGLFKASMVRKDDIDGRKSALRTSLVSGISLFVVLIIWGFTYVYLDSKRVDIVQESSQDIVTTPENTLNLAGPIEVKFDASNVPVNRDRYQIASYDWDFDDKSTGTDQITVHTFKEKRIYTVKLKITLKEKSTGKLTTIEQAPVIVSVQSFALSAQFKADPMSGEAPLEVSFDASDSSDPDATIDKYEWDFTGDSQYKDGTGKTIKHTFDKVGKYKVSLRITSTTGKSNTLDKEIEVLESVLPQAVITVVDEPKTYSMGQSYVFNADASVSPNGNINKYSWTFSDSSAKPETTKTVSHIFKAPGTHQVKLQVTDEKGKIGEVSKTITIVTPKGVPKAKISSDPAFDAKTNTLTGKAPFTVTFDAKESTDTDNNIVDYQWDFNADGKFDGFASNLSHTFTEDGTFNVALNVIDADKNVGTANLIVKVEPQGIVPAIKADVVEGNIPLTVNFDASASSYTKGQISGYKWDFGDGTPVNVGTASITHKYTAIGTFKATVTILGADNTSASKSITINVREIPLAACFVSVFEKGPAPLATSFDPGCTTGTVTNYSWNFGDGKTSTQVKPSHTFEKAGDYKVTLEVSDANQIVSKSEVTIKVTEQ